jgi:hypothetical protein
MKTKLAQLTLIINKIDRRQLQFAYFFVMLAGAIILKAPSDGGVGPY